MLLMMLPVTNSADFEQTIGEVFTAKFCRKSTNNNTFDYQGQEQYGVMLNK